MRLGLVLTRPRTGLYYARAGWSSLVARRAHNPEVEGSNPSPATQHIPTRREGAPVSQAGIAGTLNTLHPPLGKCLGPGPKSSRKRTALTRFWKAEAAYR